MDYEISYIGFDFDRKSTMETWIVGRPFRDFESKSTSLTEIMKSFFKKEWL